MNLKGRGFPYLELLKAQSLPGAGKVYIHEKAQSELRGFLLRSGAEPRFKAQFLVRLRHLNQHGRDAVSHPQWFERLKGTKRELFSMRFRGNPGSGNIRIIYCIIDPNSYLLLAFQEKDSSGYADAVRACYERMDEIEKG